MAAALLSARIWSFYIVLAVLVSVSNVAGANADVVQDNAASINNHHFDYVYRWSDDKAKPRAMAVIVHGLSMHGLVYDALARHLVERGFIVYAPDLRGYGRWHEDQADADNATFVPTETGVISTASAFAADASEAVYPPIADRTTEKEPALHARIDYRKSRADLVKLVCALKCEHPNLPLYCIGESMGAGFAMYAAAEKPNCVDGLILSSPAIKRRLHLFPRLVIDLSKGFASPKKQLDLCPYIRYFASQDQRIVEEKLNDPLVRKRINLFDMYKTLQAIRPSLKYAERVAAKTPVLIIQGAGDQILRAEAVAQLIGHLNTTDDTVKWFKNQGHLLIETAYLKPESLEAIDTWIDAHVEGGTSLSSLPVSNEIHEQLTDKSASLYEVATTPVSGLDRP